MAKLIRASELGNHPIVQPGGGPLTLSYFSVLRLEAGETHTLDVPTCELVCVVLSGRADIAACAREFRNIGNRRDVWDGAPDSVYCGTCPRVTIRAVRAGTEVAVAGGLCDQPFAPFRIAPEDVKIFELGSVDTHSYRRTYSILGAHTTGKVGRLLAGETFVGAGCWLGYPPHKHDNDHPPHETDFEEIYHYRFRPEKGFAAQFCYDGDGTAPVTAMAQNGDTFLIDRGYHPTAVSPGYEGYVFRVLVGRQQSAIVPTIEPRHQHLTSQLPAIDALA